MASIVQRNKSFSVVYTIYDGEKKREKWETYHSYEAALRRKEQLDLIQQHKKERLKYQEGTEGGEKYWRWYGFTEPVDWCACFVSWCAGEAGLIEEGIVPKFAEVNEGIRWFQEQDRWIDIAEKVDYRPSPGTLIFFDWEPDGEADHVGIVEVCRNRIIYIIEGNVNNMCVEKEYWLNDGCVKGYGVILQ